MVKQQFITAKQQAFLSTKLSAEDNSKMICAILQLCENNVFEFKLFDAILQLCEDNEFDFSNFDADAIYEHLDNAIQIQIQNTKMTEIHIYKNNETEYTYSIQNVCVYSPSTIFSSVITALTDAIEIENLDEKFESFIVRVCDHR